MTNRYSKHFEQWHGARPTRTLDSDDVVDPDENHGSENSFKESCEDA